jgi:hypothetical protein
LLLLALVVGLALPNEREPAQDGRAADIAAPRPRAVVPSDEVTGSDSRSSRVALDAGAPGFGTSPRPQSRRGSVRDLHGQAVLDVALGRIDPVLDRDPSELARTGSEGEFLLRPVPQPCQLGSIDPRWCTVHAALVEPDSGMDLVVVVAAARGIGGIVLDEVGAPVVGAQIEVRVDGSARALAGRDGSATVAQEWHASTDSAGEFALDAAPDGEGTRLLARSSGFRSASIELACGEASVLVRLARERPQGLLLRGRVVHADGSAASRATVALGPARARSGADGRFELSVPCLVPGLDLVAALAGLQPAIVAHGSIPWTSAGTAGEPIELTLGPPALAIAGRVVDEQGRPAKGWHVALLDATPLDPRAPAGTTLEELAGAQRRDVRTERDGSFSIDGLSARDYRVIAWGRSRGSSGGARGALECVVSSPIQAGQAGQADLAGTSELELVVPSPSDETSLAVLLSGPDGALLAGVCIGVPGVARIASSDGTGAFELRGRLPERLSLVFGGDGVVSTTHEIGRGAAAAPARIVLEPTARLRLDCGESAERPDALVALDGAGRPLAIGSGSPASWCAPADDGPLWIASSARTLVVWSGGAEVAREPLLPTGGAESIVSWR